ncbi:hypothetical protein L596_006438 [Steinernema carpocapsae]|uniref:Uncharacterized protein n=1 Tax=Steinernema carpocapsae TaxID=34508 RepID=A0A4U8V417_STECR|nr:hypothetical protein L596_006438 [Steinernema carpocapsae]
MRFPRQPHASFESDACGKTAEDAGRMRLERWGEGAFTNNDIRERTRRPIRAAENEAYVRRPPATSTRHQGCPRKIGRAPYKAITSVTCRSLREVFGCVNIS